MCNQKFYRDEILTMISLFKKFGGFFDKLDSHEETITHIVHQLLIDLKNETDLSNMIRINEKSLFTALLYGFQPRIFIEALKKV